MTEAEIEVIIVGGNSLFREGLKRLFATTSLSVLGEGDTIAELAHVVPSADVPTVIITVLTELPVGAGKEWRAMFETAWPGAHVLTLAGDRNDHAIISSLRAGADGCLFSDVSPKALEQAIRLVSLGENIFPTRIGQLFSLHGGPTQQPKLTPRERDILRGLLAGQSNKLIANELGTTDMTVKAQLRHLLRKLGVTNRTQAALWAREQGLDAEPEA